MKSELFIEFSGNQYSQDELVKNIKNTIVADGTKASAIKSLDVYVKPEENKAYYVVNGDTDNTKEYNL